MLFAGAEAGEVCSYGHFGDVLYGADGAVGIEFGGTPGAIGYGEKIGLDALEFVYAMPKTGHGLSGFWGEEFKAEVA